MPVCYASFGQVSPRYPIDGLRDNASKAIAAWCSKPVAARQGSLQSKGKPPFAVAILGEMILRRVNHTLADAVGHIWIFRQIPALVHQHRKRQASLEIAVIDEVLPGGAYDARLYSGADILIGARVPILIDFHTADHCPQYLNKTFIGDVDPEFPADGGYLDRATDQFERREISHSLSLAGRRSGGQEQAQA